MKGTEGVTSQWGAFYDTGGRDSNYSTDHNRNPAIPKMGFSAARSNSIYGRTTTVQNPAIQALIIIKI